MATPLFTNFARTTLASSVAVIDTAISLAATTGSLFPSPGVSEYFPLVAVDSSGNREVMYCTSRTLDTLTVTRAEEGTTAIIFSSGDTVGNRLTAGALADFTGTDIVVQKTADTGSAINPAGTTAQRDGSPDFGWSRANSTLTRMEWWDGTEWAQMGGGATGGGADEVFFMSAMAITADYTIPAGYTGITGDTVVADGVTVTVEDGAKWSIV